MFRTCKAFLPMFKSQSIDGITGARIINITSMAGMAHPFPGGCTYMASKHAANILSLGLRGEMAALGIQVCTVNPSFHTTQLVTGIRSHVLDGYNKLNQETKDQYGQGMIVCKPCFPAVSSMQLSPQLSRICRLLRELDV